MNPEETTAPVAPGDRLPMIDALRGAALFGVLVVNMLWFAGIDSAVSKEALAALPTASLDARFDDFPDLLASARAPSGFSFLASRCSSSRSSAAACRLVVAMRAGSPVC